MAVKDEDDNVQWCGVCPCSTRIGEGGLEDVESVTSNTITAHAISQQGICSSPHKKWLLVLADGF